MAVLYFEAAGLGRELEPLGRAMAELLSADLQSAEGVAAVERPERFEARAALDLPVGEAVEPDTARLVGERLQASWVVTGTLAATFEGIRIDAQLVDVGSGEARRSPSVEGLPEQVGRLQHAVASQLLAALGSPSSQVERELSLERAIALGREIDELEAAYRRRLESIETYLDQRWVRRTLKVDHIGRENTARTWAFADGRGNLIAPADAAIRAGDADRLTRMDRHRRRGRAITATSLTIGLAACASTLVWSATAPSLDEFPAGTTEFRRNQRRRSAWFAGCTVGPVLALNGVGIGTRIRRKPRHAGVYWTLEEADELLEDVNAPLAEELGLTVSDLDELDRPE